MKIYLTILLSLLVLPVFALAALDVTFSESAVITVGGSNFTVSSATIDSITVGASSFDVVLSPGASFTVTSSDRKAFTITPTEAYLSSRSCTDSQSVITLAMASSHPGPSTIVTVTPSSSACSGGTTVAAGGGSPGSAGGGASVPTPVQTTIPGTAPTPVVSSQLSVVSTAQPSPVAQIVSPVFNTTLRYGMTSGDITRLQELLATDSEIYPEGIVSGWFGALTKKAVQKFQAKYGIVSSGDEDTTGYGLVGPATRAKIQEVFSQAQPAAPAVAQPSAVAISVSPVFSSGLGREMSNSDVKRLQQLLNSDPDTIVAESGAGSSGNETEYFGSLTEKAVQKFQAKYGLAQEGDSGYGYVGPKTRAKLGEVFK